MCIVGVRLPLSLCDTHDWIQIIRFGGEHLIHWAISPAWDYVQSHSSHSFFYFYYFIFYSSTILSLYNVLWASVPLLSSYSPPTTSVVCLCLNKSLSLFVCLFSPWKLKLWVPGVGICYALCHWRFSVRQRRKWKVGGWKTARVSVFILKQSEVERPFCVLRALGSSNREDEQNPKLGAHCWVTGIDRHIMSFPLASPVLSVTLK